MKRIILAIVVFGAVITPLLFAIKQSHPVFEARSLVSFALGREYVYVPDPSLTDIRAPNPGNFEGFVNAEMLLLDNPKLVREAIEKVGLNRVYPDMPDTEDGLIGATIRLDESTMIELITGSYVVKISVFHTNPVIAAELVNALVEAFLNHRRVMYTERELTTITARLDKAQQEAEEIEGALIDLLGGPDATGLQIEYENAVRDEVSLNSELREARLNMISLQQRKSSLQNRLGFEAEALAAETEIEEAQSRITYLEREHQQTRAHIADLSEVMPKARLLQARQQAQTDRIAELDLRLRDARAVEVSGFDNVRVIEEGTPPINPVSMSENAQVAIALIVATIAALAAFMIATLLRSRPKRPSDEELNAPGVTVMKQSPRGDDRQAHLAR
ncbi:hypothetical protein [Salipiger mangrovisoli]|uniref:Chain length determinant protein n=1 Tax=Salipiger mangrovisoli TaxID=2865933 RepID=A0ABR9WZI0_9RHOB|nr:hypothetical protein [Salipiger mangrovisoli]MBE9636661.1 hypothetical protein [Salipiger mangrovisoli]